MLFYFFLRFVFFLSISIFLFRSNSFVHHFQSDERALNGENKERKGNECAY